MSEEQKNYEIVRSFKNLLKKAEQLSNEKKTNQLLERNKVFKKKIESSETVINNININNDLKYNRLGIVNIRRLPHNPFKKRTKLKGDEHERNKNDLTIKITSILNKHIHYWLVREMPKYAKIKLRKNIYTLLINISKKKNHD